MSSDPVAISVSGIGKRYKLGELERYDALRDAISGLITWPARLLRRRREQADGDGYMWALRDVSFDVAPGQIVGIIGRNGAGKSTLLKLLSRITQPTEGSADIFGRVGALLEVGTGFHPELTGRENTYLNGAILGMGKQEIDRKFDDIVSFAGVELFIDTPVKRYSSGMQVRLAFAVAAHLEPDILLIDEVLAVGDAEFQKRCLGRMEEVSSQGRTVVFISHSMPAVLRLCPRVILLEGGRLIEDGRARDVVKTYLETGLGTTAAREWSSLDQAPGDDAVRLRAVRVLDETGRTSEEIDIHKPVDVEVEYWLRRPMDPAPGVTLTFWNSDNVMLFASSNLSDRRPSTAAAAVVRARCRIPGNLLAEGEIYVKVLVLSQSPPTHHVVEPDVVGFHVVDRTKGEGARGSLVGDWPGVVRPKLPWTTDVLDDDGTRR